MNKIDHIFFDLDGTLADTAPDLTMALNVVRKKRGLPKIQTSLVRTVASNGANAILYLGLGETLSSDEFQQAKTEFLTHYSLNLVNKTVLYDNMPELLDKLEGCSIAWGVITNKPKRFTEPLIDGLGLTNRTACIVSGDSTNAPKPAPDPMFLACKITDSRPENCLYVGDAQRDIEAGKRSGMRTLVAMFGYINKDDKPKNWGADGMVYNPSEILDWVNIHNKTLN